MNFSFENLGNDLFQINKEYCVNKDGHGSDISGPYWMLIKCKILSGEIWWKSDNQKKISEGNEYFIFVPPFSWTTEYYKKDTTISLCGLISKKSISTKFNYPILFETKLTFPKRINEVEKLLKKVSKFENISLCTKPSALSLRAKDLIDNHFHNGIEIGEIAVKLKSNSAYLSRCFKSDFGHPPVFYKKGLKVTCGMFELMMGTAPVEAAQIAGYNDLSRFYKQFKQYLRQTPSEYLEKSKNAKK